MSDQKIQIFDDILPLSMRAKIYDASIRSNFSLLGWTDSGVPERHAHNLSFFSVWSDEMLQQIGLIPALASSVISPFRDYKLSKTVLNLTTPSDIYWAHAHPEEKVLLYYVNQEWQEGWHGETQFYSENLKEVKYTSPYTPGRFILFDGSIPHTMRPQSIIAPKFRFSLSMFLTRK